MKFTKGFSGVIDGDVYPTEFKEGQDCPTELEEAALEMQAIIEDSDKAIVSKTPANA